MFSLLSLAVFDKQKGETSVKNKSVIFALRDEVADYEHKARELVRLLDEGFHINSLEAHDGRVEFTLWAPDSATKKTEGTVKLRLARAEAKLGAISEIHGADIFFGDTGKLHGIGRVLVAEGKAVKNIAALYSRSCAMKLRRLQKKRDKTWARRELACRPKSKAYRPPDDSHMR